MNVPKPAVWFAVICYGFMFLSAVVFAHQRDAARRASIELDDMVITVTCKEPTK